MANIGRSQSKPASSGFDSPVRNTIFVLLVVILTIMKVPFIASDICFVGLLHGVHVKSAARYYIKL